MWKLILILTFFVLHGGVCASQSDCLDLRKKSIESDLSRIVGGAILYSMDSKKFDETISCLLSIYIQQDVAIAGLKWDITHALLRIMAADPDQFFSVLAGKDVQAVERWVQSLDHAAIWPGERCPRLNPLIMSRKAIENLKLDKTKGEVLRGKVFDQLKKWPCRVAS